jgi:hypothetical protein
MSYPQPYEGVTGTDREDLLLSLDPGAAAHRQVLYQFAKATWRAVLVGQPAPVTRELAERMTRPEPGDLVFMTFQHDPEPWWHGLGVLLAKRDEWAETDAQWDAFLASRSAGALQRLTEPRAVYLQYGPGAGDIARWANASAVAIPWAS